MGRGRKEGQCLPRDPRPPSPVSAGSSAGGEGAWGMQQGLCDGVGFEARPVLIIQHLQLGNLGHNDLPTLCLSFSI